MSREVLLLTATKRAAENVMADQRALVEVDKRRQDMRQAARALDTQVNDDRITLMTGSVMIKLPKEEVKNILKKGMPYSTISIN